MWTLDLDLKAWKSGLAVIHFTVGRKTWNYVGISWALAKLRRAPGHDSSCATKATYLHCVFLFMIQTPWTEPCDLSLYSLHKFHFHLSAAVTLKVQYIPADVYNHRPHVLPWSPSSQSFDTSVLHFVPSQISSQDIQKHQLAPSALQVKQANVCWHLWHTCAIIAQSCLCSSKF